MAALGIGIALSAGLAVASAPNEGARPLSLEVQHNGETLVLKVVGRAAQATDASYSLAVTSQSSSGSNTTHQSGRGHVVPGQIATLTTVAVSNRPGTSWRAALEVTPVGSAAYTIVEAAPAG